MAETYCLKSCAECQMKEQLSCPGCRQGPGERFKGDCALKKCCVGRGHETCETCNQNSWCGTFRGRERMPENRLKEMEAERQYRQVMAHRAPILGKWLTVLFWLLIPGMIASLMLEETFAAAMPGLRIPGIVLQGLCILASGGILLRLSRLEEKYKIAAICSVIAQAASLATTQLVNQEMLGLRLVITIPLAILGLVGKYHEFMGHSDVLVGVDGDQAAKWETLWKWTIGMELGAIGCILLTAIIPLLGAVVLLVVSIGTVVVGILEMVYLYRTGRIFRGYAQELED
jgi:hypothetical protein